MHLGHAPCGRTDAISDPRLHPEYFPTLGCSGQSGLPEDSVEVELDLMAQKGSMDGNVSRPANQGSNPGAFTEAAMAGYGACRPLRRVPAIVSFLNSQPALRTDGQALGWETGS